MGNVSQLFITKPVIHLTPLFSKATTGCKAIISEVKKNLRPTRFSTFLYVFTVTAVEMRSPPYPASLSIRLKYW